jgi:hypothetical protein
MISTPPKQRLAVFLILAVLLALAVAGGGFYFFIWAPGRAGNPAVLPGPRSEAVTLYFYAPVSSKAVTRSFRLPEHLTFSEQIRAILEKMVEKNPDPAATLWPSVLRFHNVFLRKNGLLILDLEQGVTYNQASAVSEWRILRSLAGTLLANYSNVSQVKFLVNGMEQDTLNGHVALSWPFNSRELEP